MIPAVSTHKHYSGSGEPLTQLSVGIKGLKGGFEGYDANFAGALCPLIHESTSVNLTVGERSVSLGGMQLKGCTKKVSSDM